MVRIDNIASGANPLAAVEALRRLIDGNERFLNGLSNPWLKPVVDTERCSGTQYLTYTASGKRCGIAD